MDEPTVDDVLTLAREYMEASNNRPKKPGVSRIQVWGEPELSEVAPGKYEFAWNIEGHRQVMGTDTLSGLRDEFQSELDQLRAERGE